VKIGAKLNDEEKAQIGLSKMERRAQHAGSVPEAVFRLPGTPSKMVAFTPIRHHLENVG
jgi:hypothetical protein